MTKLDAGLITSLPASDPGSAGVWGSKRIPSAPVLFVSDLKWIPLQTINEQNAIGIRIVWSRFFVYLVNLEIHGIPISPNENTNEII